MIDERLRLLGASLSAAFDAMAEATADVCGTKSTSEVVKAKFAFANKLLQLVDTQLDKLEGELTNDTQQQNSKRLSAA